MSNGDGRLWFVWLLGGVMVVNVITRDCGGPQYTQYPSCGYDCACVRQVHMAIPHHPYLAARQVALSSAWAHPRAV